MDFFSGSATTAHAVMQLNAEDNGHRKFIMVQLPEKTDEKSEAYKAGYTNICEIGKERIVPHFDRIAIGHMPAAAPHGIHAIDGDLIITIVEGIGHIGRELCHLGSLFLRRGAAAQQYSKYDGTTT